MDKEKALQIIKQTIDHAVSSGLFKNIDSVVTVSQAYQYIQQELNKIQDLNSNTQ